MHLLSDLSHYQIILGSKSPRRKLLLEGLGVDFECRTKEVDESFPDNLPIHKVAEYLAIKKAKAFEAELSPNELLITSDTTVCLPNAILNKPVDAEAAKTMLRQLSDQMHEVVSGVCLLSQEQQISFSERTKVFFKSLSETEIDYYVEQYQPFDKAGAYGIQEWIGFIGIEKIEGDYYNVMGLPLQKLYETLNQFKST